MSFENSQPIFDARAMYDFAASEDGELPLKRGDVIHVYDATSFQVNHGCNC